jgi:thiol:disulfide interchange protein DsbG
MTKFSVASLLVASLCLPSLAMAQAAGKPASAASLTPPPGLSAPLKGGLTVEKKFEAASGLTGWVMKSPDGQYTVFYTTSDGNLMIAGALVDKDGNNLTQIDNEKHVPKPDLQALWGKLEKSAWFASGATKNPKSTIYVFLDPNCIFCHYIWMALEPYEAAGLQVRWIPVGFLKEDSAGKAAAIMTAKDPAAAHLQHQKDFKTGGIKPVAVPPELKAKLDANAMLMREAGFRGTPGTIFKDSSGKVMKRDGMPRLPDLPTITGLPAQAQTNPEMDRFK